MNQFKHKSTKTLRIGISIFVLILTFGIVGYMVLEEYSFIDALYMTIITVSTVGFGEIKPLSEVGRLFTSALILMSLGNLAYLGTAVVTFIVEGELFEYIKNNRVNKRIHKLTDHVIVCGFGRNGEQACLELQDHEQDFVIIEKRDNVIDRIKESPNMLYIKGDATHEEILIAAGIDRAKALIATTPNDADNVFVVLTAREMNPNLKIISRASERGSDMKLKRAGANNVIMPERMGGQRMSKLVMQPDVVEFMEYVLLQSNKDVALEEIGCDYMCRMFEGRTIDELKRIDVSGINIVGVKQKSGKYIFNPQDNYELDRADKLFVLGSVVQVSEFRKTLERGK
ncbi:NAD-binding protein [Halosquirtibacter xylanolyticus]|uniref:potassium channel family protein n=1 Tax=Halosquirtibacter xylanolyticus TaxID=3374599 RepID=UPI003747945E|nr:NAD-binding protein [Prolixibacteraceae bacterium]